MPHHTTPSFPCSPLPLSGPALQELTDPGFIAPPEACSSASWASLIVVCIPYTLRIVQCVSVFIRNWQPRQVGSSDVFPFFSQGLRHQYSRAGDWRGKEGRVLSE